MNSYPGRVEFDDFLTRGEKIFLWIYLPIHMFGIPMLLGATPLASSLGFSDADANVAYYAVGALLMLIFLRGFLRRSFDRLCDRALLCLFSVLLGYMAVAVLSSLAAMAASLFKEELENLNNDNVIQMAGTEYGKTVAMAVFLAPLVEEPLFRAGIFGTLRPKHRVWAYVVSVVIFALYHVWQYVLVYSDPTYLLVALEYIPAGLALCWVYDRTGSLWTPIFLHMLINWVNIAALTMAS
jgi:membrane protease YdiL (CAAX protease family)